MKCPTCETENDAANRFCDACGSRLEVVGVKYATVPSVPSIICPSCGAVVLPDEDFCDECGASLFSIKADNDVAKIVQEIDTDAVRQDIAHYQSLIFTIEKNLQLLEKQAAKFGPLYAPSYILLEIEDIKAKIKEHKQHIGLAKNKLTEPLNTYVKKMEDEISFAKKFIKDISSVTGSLSEIIAGIRYSPIESDFRDECNSILDRLNKKREQYQRMCQKSESLAEEAKRRISQVEML